ncbi:DNA phosphorothioation-associated protein 4 [Devosia marina]|uniref:DNA phosphorothioation-associated protein 4 n=1 Tax=Devosia marina TaxID=2683198 RepID=A0A7X3FS51_9HYPH|nr:DNA phosphorothioation-associated protein 4 [Devosia marina]MVS99783.1 DNA phosphorothioation-associated protein 4 [Devosia marina]
MSNRAANIHRSRIHEDMVQRLAMTKLPGTDRTLFPTIRELLCFAALLGYSEGRRVPLDRSAGTEDVSYQQFERRDAEDLIFLIALADSKDPEILKDGEEGRCAEIFEEYANGGLQVLRDAMLRSGGEYPDRDILELLKKSGYLNIEEAEPDIDGINF